MISCIIIGAGPGGIVTTKELLENGFDDILCLEKSNELGSVCAKTYNHIVKAGLRGRVRFALKPILGKGYLGIKK